MKTFRNLTFLLFATLLVVSCSKDHDEPPLNEPKYKGPSANKTIAQFKAEYAKITEPTYIGFPHVIKAYVTGNDISGNIYKQLYVEDETGGINLGVDQSSVYTTYQVGQEVYIDLHGLAAVKYGGELQIGYVGTQANRIPWNNFQENIHRDKWANSDNVMPKVVTLDKLDPSMVNTLVQIDDIYFVDAGKLDANGDSLALTEKQATTNRQVKDVKGKSIDVRTSSYSATLAKKVLPMKYGSIVGILGRYNDGWQFFLRDANDIKQFGKEAPIVPEEPETSFFKETFGSKDVSLKPLIAVYDGYTMAAPVKYTALEGKLDVRSTAALGNFVWLPKEAVGRLKIEGINTTGKKNIKLTYSMTANIYNPGDQMNVNALKVKCDDKDLTVPSFILTKDEGYGNKFYVVEIGNLPENFTTLEFYSSAADNTLGLRLDEIILEESSTLVVEP